MFALVQADASDEQNEDNSASSGSYADEQEFSTVPSYRHGKGLQDSPGSQGSAIVQAGCLLITSFFFLDVVGSELQLDVERGDERSKILRKSCRE